MKTIAIAGPRPGALYGYDRTNYRDLEARLLECIKKLTKGEEATIICSSEQGAGQTAFAAAVKARRDNPKIKIHVYRAFVGEDMAWSPSGGFGQIDYDAMLDAADKAINCGYDLDLKAGRSSAKHNRAHMMAEAADGVVVVSTFTSPDDLVKTPGETAHLMRDALARGCALWSIHPETFEATRLDQ